MADNKVRSYNMVPRKGSAGDAQVLTYRYTFTAAPLSLLADVLRYFRLPRGFKPSECILQFSDNDSGANGRVDVIVTNDTTTYTLISAADISAAGTVRGGNAAGAHDWLGKVLSGKDAQWYAALKVSTALSTPVAAGFYALTLIGTADPAPDSQ